MAADKKAAEKAAAVVTAKNIDIGTNNAAITRHVAQFQDADPRERLASTVGMPTTGVDHPHSDGVGTGYQGPSTVQAVQVFEGTKVRPELTSAEAKEEASTTHSPQLYDIVALAQLILAQLPSPKRKASGDSMSVEVQSYALRPLLFSLKLII